MAESNTIFCSLTFSSAPEMLSTKFLGNLVTRPRKDSLAFSSTDTAVSVRPCHRYPVLYRGSCASCLHTSRTPQTCHLPEVRDVLPHNLHRFQVLVVCPAVQPPVLGLVSGRSVDQRRTDGQSSAEPYETCRFALGTYIPQDLAT